MKIIDTIIKRKKTVIIIWVILLLLTVPALLGYSQFISYSSTGSLPSTAESQVAQNILDNYSTQNSSVEILVLHSPYTGSGIANQTLQFQQNISSAGLRNVSHSESPFSAYASYITSIIEPYSQGIRTSYSLLRNSSASIFSLPENFVLNWSRFNFNPQKVNASFTAAALNSHESQYNESFASNVSQRAEAFSSNLTPAQAYEVVNESISIAANRFMTGTYDNVALLYLGLDNYSSSLSKALSEFYMQAFNISVNPEIVSSVIQPGNPGNNFVHAFGLSGIPSFISNGYIDQNGDAFLVFVYFNVPSGYIGPKDYIPSSADTPSLQGIIQKSFHGQAYLTGNGPIQYETQQLTAEYAFVFGVLFIILAIAVSITLFSWKAFPVAFGFVGGAYLLGYAGIYLSGLLLHHINYIVSYTLTAIAVGVVTDYLVFISSRYRQELKKGKQHEEALMTASSKAGKAVVISGVTVGLSLFTFSFIRGFESWGIVLLISVMMIVAFVTTLLPAVLALFGPGFFTKKSIKKYSENHLNSSLFYRAADFSRRRKFVVIAAILIIGVPSAYFFLHVPTTYNFNTGLPQELEAVTALNAIDEKFGSNLIYPVEILVSLGTQGHNLSGKQISQLQGVARSLLSTSGVTRVVGPYSNGTAFSDNVSYSQYLIGNGRYSLFLAYTSYQPYSASAQSVVSSIRDNSTLIVGGITSSVIDQKQQNATTFSELEILIVAVIFVVLLISFRSLKYPIISLSGVFISISWTTVILFFISTYILHEGLIYLIPVILFIILMSLGNDYTVFIISRVREYEKEDGFEKGMPAGMASSAGVVTSLGIILAISLGSLGIIKDGFLQQLGIAFLISLIIDTFIIRVFYFPAMLSALRRKS